MKKSIYVLEHSLSSRTNALREALEKANLLSRFGGRFGCPDPLKSFFLDNHCRPSDAVQKAMLEHLNLPTGVNFSTVLDLVAVSKEHWQEIEKASAYVVSVISHNQMHEPFVFDSVKLKYIFRVGVMEELRESESVFLSKKEDVELYERFESLAFDFSQAFNAMAPHFSGARAFIAQHVPPFLKWDKASGSFKVDGEIFYHAFIVKGAERPSFTKRERFKLFN